jgi:dTDP-4-amino-4,6-dideoxygalactose transaminase
MAGGDYMYIPAWPSLNPAFFVHPEHRQSAPFPLNSPDSRYFYVARNGIYNLFRRLGFANGEVVLAPDYHHGNEIYAIRAAGASIVYYTIQHNLDLDLDAVIRLCRTHHPRALYITHFIGWPQPMHEIRKICNENGLMLIEDCALSFLSSHGGAPLGSLGDYSVFCLYKTLPVPNGGVLVSNKRGGGGSVGTELTSCSPISVAGRSVELMLQWLRMRHEWCGRALFATKRWIGSSLSAASVERVPVGNTGFDAGAANLAMSGVSQVLLRRFDYEWIRNVRRRNFGFLQEALSGKGTLLPWKLTDDVCPLFFPLLVKDKRQAARALWSKGIETVEFWNNGDPEARRDGFPAEFLRRHVLEVPIHQDLTLDHLDHVAKQMPAVCI